MKCLRCQWPALLLLLVVLTASCSRRTPKEEAPPKQAPQSITWAQHVAPILDARCGTCHRDGQSAPFGLLEWADVSDHAEQIGEVIASKYMPPWKATTAIGHFANDRSMPAEEADVIARWIQQGAQQGDPARRPAIALLADGWALGPPDLIVALPTGYTLPAEGTDVYRNFVIEAPADQTRWIRAWEFKPTNARVVHHAIVNIDRTGWARGASSADPQPGFGGMDVGEIQSPDGFYLVWAPGNQAAENRAGTAWRLDKQTDLVAQLHLQPTGKPEPVGAQIGLYFAKEAPIMPSFTLRIGDVFIDLPAGAADVMIQDQWTLPVAGELVSAFPHAHYLARTFRIEATQPGGDPQLLLGIDDWDFVWQDQYRWAEPVKLAAGTKLSIEIHYDNSADNFRNPSRPPVRVRTGPNSTDEMGNVTFEFMPDSPADAPALREGKYRRDIQKGFGLVRAHYNLANVLRGRGDLEGAIGEYQAALKLVPDHFHALANLTIALQQAKRSDQARAIAARVLALRPGDPGTLTTLGTLERDAGRLDEARAHYEAALRTNPGYAAALNNLAAMAASRGEEAALPFLRRAAEAGDRDAIIRLALRDHAAGQIDSAIARLKRGIHGNPGDPELRLAIAGMLLQARRVEPALKHLQKAAKAAPGHGMVRYRLGGALSATGRQGDAEPHLREAARLMPEFGPVQNDLGVLAAQRGDMKTALTHFERAVALDPSDARALENLQKARGATPK